MNRPQERKIRERNTRIYRLCHWPIWIWVSFSPPARSPFRSLPSGFHWGNWPGSPSSSSAPALPACYGQLPGAEPRPYILRFDEDKPNPLYRRICYTFAWNAVLNFALLNLAGLVIAAVTGVWYMKQVYTYAYFPLCAVILFLGAIGKLPRVGPSTQTEGTERRYFYGTVWAVTAAQTLTAGPLEDPAPHPRHRPDQARRLFRRAARHGPLAQHGKLHRTTPHPPRRADRVRLRMRLCNA